MKQMIDNPMWFTEYKPLNEDSIQGYCQAVYQIRLYLDSLDQEPEGVRQYTEIMIEELNKIKL